MFTHLKKDFYSVNANISLSPMRNQMAMLDEEGMMQMMQDGNQQYSQDMQYAGQGGSEMAMMSMKQPNSPTSQSMIMGNQPRYDDVYYPRTDKRMIKGNAYAFEGNEYMKQTNQASSVEESIEQIIVNQEQGRSPMEYFNPLSRAKLTEMKNLKVPKNVKSYQGLYQDSVISSTFHEKQRFGHINDKKQEWRKQIADTRHHEIIEETPVVKKHTAVVANESPINSSNVSARSPVHKIPSSGNLDFRLSQHSFHHEQSELYQFNQSPVKNLANFNIIFSLDNIEILKKCIKEKVLEGAIEEDDELCKRMNRGLVKIADVMDLIGKIHAYGQTNLSNPSKFKRRTTRTVAQIIPEGGGADFFLNEPAQTRTLTSLDEESGLQVIYKPIILSCSDKHLIDGDLAINQAINSKLYFLTQCQIEKSILMSIQRSKKSENLSIDEEHLQLIVENMTLPPYRNVFTKLTSASISVVQEDGSFLKNTLSIDMPFIQMNYKETNADKKKIKYKKYLEPSEFNVFAKDKFRDWKNQAIGYFEKYRGEKLTKPNGQFKNLKSNSYLFARNTSDNENILFDKELNHSNSNSLSTIVIPSPSDPNQVATYLRLQGYSLVLVDAKNGSNLTTLHFNLQSDFEKLLDFDMQMFDLAQLFAMEVKVFYNTALEYWKMFIDVKELHKKYEKQLKMWQLPQGRRQRIKIPLHIDNHRLFLILQTPKLVYADDSTNFNEKMVEFDNKELKTFQDTKMKQWEEFCYKKVLLKTQFYSMQPQVFFVLGGPGSGKGTQCAKMVSKYGFVHLSAGDLLREERDSGSETATLINQYIVDGKIVPVDITCDLLKKAMEKSGWGAKKFLIDGFPRNLDNLQGWHKVMEELVNLAFILFLDADEETMIERILERSKTSGRNDDNIESLKKRFVTFKKETMPVVQIFEKQGKVRKIDALGSVEEVFEEIEEAFEGYI